MKKKYGIYIGFLLLIITSFVISQEKDIIIWENQHQLKWEYYKGTVDPNKDFSAVSKIGMTTNYKETRDSIIVAIKTSFKKKESWVKPDCKTSNLLNHEQKHFDLEEVFSRKYRKLCYDNKDSLNADLFNEFYAKIREELNQTNYQYDQETNFSLSVEGQNIWNKKISCWLHELDDYKDTMMVFYK